jgi:two-component system, cell cycle response regulator DivK
MKRSAVRARPKRVLFIEDNQDERVMYTARMRVAGWEVEELETGVRALDVARVFHPDVIVTDMTMPELDGVAATRRLKADQGARHIPVIAISAYPERSWEAYGAGCHTFLSKPCLPETLLEIMESVLDEDEPSSPKHGSGGLGG